MEALRKLPELILKSILTTWRDEFVNMENPQELLWDYVQKYVDGKSGYLIADDTIMDKPRGPKIEGLFWKAQTFGKGAVSGQFGVDRWEIRVSRCFSRI